MDNLGLKVTVENIVTKGEIARFVQFLLLSLCFQKAVCCRGIRKRFNPFPHVYNTISTADDIEKQTLITLYCIRQIMRLAKHI